MDTFYRLINQISVEFCVTNYCLLELLNHQNFIFMINITCYPEVAAVEMSRCPAMIESVSRSVCRDVVSRLLLHFSDWLDDVAGGFVLIDLIGCVCVGVFELCVLGEAVLGFICVPVFVCRMIHMV